MPKTTAIFVQFSQKWSETAFFAKYWLIPNQVVENANNSDVVSTFPYSVNAGEWLQWDRLCCESHRCSEAGRMSAESHRPITDVRVPVEGVAQRAFLWDTVTSGVEHRYCHRWRYKQCEIISQLSVSTSSVYVWFYFFWFVLFCPIKCRSSQRWSLVEKCPIGSVTLTFNSTLYVTHTQFEAIVLYVL